MRSLLNLLVLLVLLVGAHPALAQAGGRSLDNLADIVQPLMPAVVNISTTQKSKARQPHGEPALPELPPGAGFDDLQDFFEQFYGQQGRSFGDGAVNPRVQSLGSGFIVDASGLIVTNHHVIDGADEIIVRTQDGAEYKAKLVGRDAKTDLAVLKVDAGKALPFVRFGDSNSHRVGDWVIAIGNPFGLGGSVTVGIISARARDINAGPFDDFIQTDAAINSGNSGGPMFNVKGEVIGINTAIFSPSGGNVGIGFATPSALASPVIEQLKKLGKVRWGWLGVKIQSVSKEIAESLGMPEARGALVVEITQQSPAARAGLQPGDLIVAFDGQKVTEMRVFPRMVAQTPIGKEVTLQIVRNGKETTLKAVVEEAKDVELASDQRPEMQEEKQPVSKLERVQGMQMQPVTPAVRQEFDVPEDVSGLLVVDVERGSPAWEQGIRPDDVLMRINEANLAKPQDLKEQLDKAAKEGRKFALLRVFRQGDTHFVTMATTTK